MQIYRDPILDCLGHQEPWFSGVHFLWGLQGCRAIRTCSLLILIPKLHYFFQLSVEFLRTSHWTSPMQSLSSSVTLTNLQILEHHLVAWGAFGSNHNIQIEPSACFSLKRLLKQNPSFLMCSRWYGLFIAWNMNFKVILCFILCHHLLPVFLKQKRHLQSP